MLSPAHGKLMSCKKLYKIFDVLKTSPSLCNVPALCRLEVRASTRHYKRTYRDLASFREKSQDVRNKLLQCLVESVSGSPSDHHMGLRGPSPAHGGSGWSAWQPGLPARHPPGRPQAEALLPSASDQSLNLRHSLHPPHHGALLWTQG